MSQPAFLFNPNTCTGCSACVIACQIENQLPQVQNALQVASTPWRTVYTFNPAHSAGLPTFHLSLACNHCQTPACQSACPAAAYTKDPLTGAVTIDPQKCIGCRYCSWACPFDAPKYNPVHGVMEKCTFCNHRLLAGSEPACVKACPTRALTLITPDDVSTISASSPIDASAETQFDSGFPRTTLKPSIRFTPLRGGTNIGTSDGTTAGTQEFRTPLGLPIQPSKITFAHEWPLWFLTGTFMVLFAWFAGTPLQMHRTLPILDLVFLTSGGAAMLASTLHLGQPLRAWRALLNLRTSWLSREIFFISFFLGLSGFIFGVAHLLTSAILWNSIWQLILYAVGLCALFSIDCIYDVALNKQALHEGIYRPRARWHSASSLLGGIYLAGLAAAFGPYTLHDPLQVNLSLAGWVAGLLQLGLYINRHHTREPQTPLSSVLRAVRVIVGFAVPFALLVLRDQSWAAFTAAVIGMIIDRLEFYDELEILAPGW